MNSGFRGREPDSDSGPIPDSAGSVARYQITPRSVIVYLRELGPEKPLVLRYRLRATMPVKTTAAPAQAYEYYNPDRRAASATARLTVGPRT